MVCWFLFTKNGCFTWTQKKCFKIEEGWTNKEDALKAGKNFAVRLAILQSILVCFGSFPPEYSQDKKKSKEYQTTEHKKSPKNSTR